MSTGLGSTGWAGHADPMSQTSTQIPSPQEHPGLSAAEVAERVRAGRTNAYRVRTSRSAAAILRANVFTIFNAILATALVVVLAVGHWADALFGIVLILNTATGTIAEVRAKRALDRLAFLEAPTACAVRDGREVELDVADVVLDDVLRLRSGEQVPADAAVLTADGLEVDESILTGESDPVRPRAGDRVLSGTTVTAGTALVRTTAVGADAYANRLAREARRYSVVTSELQVGTNRVLRWISWVIVPVALLLLWSQMRGTAISAAGASTGQWRPALVAAVAGVVGMVPQGLVLLTSVNFATASLTLARRRVLVQELPAVEVLARVDTLCLDKTGTLTSGRLKVSKFTHSDKFDASALFSLVSGSDHPVSRAVGEYLRANFKDLKLLELSGFENIAARGTQAKFDGKKLAGGSEKFMRELGLYNGEAVHGTSYFFAVDGEVLAVFELEESLKEGAKECVDALKNAGIRVAMLTGDNEYAAKRVAEGLGVDETVANALPTDKAAYVERLAQQGRNVLMVGDGINDAAALALSSVAVCMGSGAAVSIEKSDVVLMRDDPASLAAAVALARKTYRIVRQNLAFSLVYNAVTIPLAMAGYVAPAVAALSMSLSSVAVVLNAMRARSER